MKELSQQIHDQIGHVVNKILFKEKRRIIRFKEISLYPSEVHLILEIVQNRDTNATRIAEALGLTKGAVSQTLTRLEKKGILTKTKDPYNKNELTLSLTPMGQEACALCLEIRDSFARAQEDFISTLDPVEKTAVLKFLKHMDRVMETLG